jgi:DNA-binding HxlR family transcriptional regulator
MAAFDLLGRRWVLRILWELRNEGLGFRELQRAADDPSPTLLAERLVDLRAARVVLPREDGKYELT